MTLGLRLLRVIADVAGALVLLTALLGGGLVWRLAAGPLDITAAARAAAARALPGVQVGQVTLALDGRLLRLAVTDLQAGEGGPQLAHGAVALEVAPLLHGAIRPRDVTIDGLRAHFIRAADRTISVRGLPSGGAGGGFDPAVLLRRLVQVTIHNTALTGTDAATQQSSRLDGLEADIRRDADGGLFGHARALLTTGTVSSDVTVDAARPPGDASSRLQVAVAAVNPAALARLLPVLAPLSALDASLAVTGVVALTPGLGLQHLTLHIESGAGHAFLPAKGGGSSQADFASLKLDVDGNVRAVRLSGLQIVLAPPSGSPPSTVTVTGEMARDPNHTVAKLHVTLDRAQMADLGALWPVGVGGGSRPWLVENVPAGAVHDGAFDLTLQAGASLDDVALTAASGSMQAEDVTLYWLRPVPPISFAHVVLTVLDPDQLTIVPTGAHEGALVGRHVIMKVWGMATKDQFSQIDGDITAPIADVFSLLKHPRLQLLSVHPLPIDNPTGQSVTHLTVKLPLENKVTMADVGIDAVTHLTDVKIGRLVAGRPLDQGVFDAEVNQDGLTLSGTARVAGIASALTVNMDFRGGPPSQVVEHVTAAAHADNKAMAAAGLDTIGLLDGTVAAKLDYSELRGGTAVLQGSADLAAAALSTPIGWSKPAGPAASIEARAELDHGQLAGFDGIRAEGPDLSVQGTSETVNGRPSILHIDHCVIGRTSLAGTVSFPAQPGDALKVAVAGPQLDLAGPLSNKTTFEPSTPADVKPGRPYQVDVHFGRVLVGKTGEGIGPVSLTARGDDRRIGQAHLHSAGPEQLDARIEPLGETRRIVVAVGDFGQLLRRLGSSLDIARGALVVNGVFDDRRAGSPLTATASLVNFGVRGAPVIGKLLQGMTLYGLVDALSGPGLVFDRLTMPFTEAGSVLDLRGAQAFSASLGLTATGQVDFGRGTMDLTGTIVPAYFFNALLGRMPLIGPLFSPEPGGGVFAATYAVKGPTGDPDVSVNPLATLTPGVLRGLFGLFK